MFSTLVALALTFVPGQMPTQQGIDPYLVQCFAWSFLPDRLDTEDLAKAMLLARPQDAAGTPAAEPDPEVVRKTAEELRRDIRAARNKTLTLGFNTKIRSLDAAKGEMELINPFTVGTIVAQTGLDSPHPLLPPRWDLLIANPALFTRWQLSPEQVKTLKLDRDNGNRTRIRLALNLAPAALSGTRSLQTVVTEARIMIDGSDKPVAVNTEKRSLAKVLRARILRAGVTLDVTPNHSFTVFGHRLLEPLIEESKRAGKCEEKGEVKGHSRIVCNSEVRFARSSLRVEGEYIGGRGVRYSFFFLKDAEVAVANSAWRQIAGQFRRPTAFPTEDQSWTAAETDFSIDAGVFASRNPRKPFFEARSKLLNELPEARVLTLDRKGRPNA